MYYTEYLYICVYEGYIRFSQQFRFHTTTHLQTAKANIYGWPNDNCIETKSADFTMCPSYNSNNTNENLNNCHAVSRIVMCIRQQCIYTIVTFSSSLIHICFYSRVKKKCVVFVCPPHKINNSIHLVNECRYFANGIYI